MWNDPVGCIGNRSPAQWCCSNVEIQTFYIIKWFVIRCLPFVFIFIFQFLLFEIVDDVVYSFASFLFLFLHRNEKQFMKIKFVVARLFQWEFYFFAAFRSYTILFTIKWRDSYPMSNKIHIYTSTYTKLYTQRSCSFFMGLFRGIFGGAQANAYV